MFVLLEAEVGGRAGKVSGGMWNTVLFMNNTIIFPFALTAVRVGGGLSNRNLGGRPYRKGSAHCRA